MVATPTWPLRGMKPAKGVARERARWKEPEPPSEKPVAKTRSSSTFHVRRVSRRTASTLCTPFPFHQTASWSPAGMARKVPVFSQCSAQKYFISRSSSWVRGSGRETPPWRSIIIGRGGPAGSYSSGTYRRKARRFPSVPVTHRSSHPFSSSVGAAKAGPAATAAARSGSA